MHSELSSVLGTDLVIVSSTENYCHIAFITYNDFEVDISSYSPELSFSLERISLGLLDFLRILTPFWQTVSTVLFVKADMAFNTCEHIFNGHHHLRIWASHKNTCTPPRNLASSLELQPYACIGCGMVKW